MKPPRPLLPVSAKLLPYLSRIDESRYYSNGGPLLLEYERKMSEHFNCGVVAVSSATAGLTACLPKGCRTVRMSLCQVGLFPLPQRRCVERGWCRAFVMLPMMELWQKQTKILRLR